MNRVELIQEIEKAVQGHNEVLQIKRFKSVALVDVMNNVRKVSVRNLKTFGDFCVKFGDLMIACSSDASRIDFVYDSYSQGSVKDSE